MTAAPAAPTVNWGVIGPGRIAHRFAACLAAVPGARLAAVAGRDPAQAAAFARHHGNARAHGSYEALYENEGVDAVYIAAPHSLRAELALAALRAGKSVLCEKPLTVDASQTRQVFDTASRYRRFAMEAFWSRFLPVYRQVQAWLAKNQIGRITSVEAYFGYEQSRLAGDRLQHSASAGGALLDAGIYAVSLSQFLFKGPLTLLDAQACLSKTGVDEDLQARLKVGDGVSLYFRASMVHKFYNSLAIHGQQGHILVSEPFWETGQAFLMRHGRAPVASHCPFDLNGFEYQVREVHQCLQRGAIESTVMPWADTLAVMNCMDQIRAHVGVHHPFEPHRRD